MVFGFGDDFQKRVCAAATQAQAALVRHPFPLATVVTPNLPETEALLGRRIADFDLYRKAGLEK